jgi:outer membrane murein-binding lipoprotein Lpp
MSCMLKLTKSSIATAALAVLMGCATVNIDQVIDRTNTEVKSVSGATAQLLRTVDAKAARYKQASSRSTGHHQ